MAAMDGEVIYLSPTYSGSVHDKKICNLEILTFSKKLQVFVDLGFLGLTSSTAQIVIPHKPVSYTHLCQRFCQRCT